jgi:hypothetical protein
MSPDFTLPHFDVGLPAGWQDQTAYTFVGPELGGLQHILTLIVDHFAGDTELVDYARERIDLLIDSMTGLEVLKEEEKTLASGLEAYEVVVKWLPTDENVIFRKQVYIVDDGIGYTFSINFSKRTMKTIGVQIDQIIDSFRPGGEEE